MSNRTRWLRVLSAALSLALVASLAACGDSGVKVESSPPMTSAPPSTSSTAPTSTKPTPTDTSTVATSFGDAQPAVDVFVTLSAAYNTALQSPATASATTFTQLVAGQAKEVFEQSLADEKAQGKAFRGSPPVDRLIMTTSDLTASVPSVTLEDCVLDSTSEPWTEYVVSTGAAVPPATPSTVPPPYTATIKIFKPTAAGWVVTSYTLDGTKTCSR